MDERAAITYVDDSTVLIVDQPSRFMLDEENGKRIYLAGGVVRVTSDRQPKDSPLQVITDHAEVTVLGTQFTVSKGLDATRCMVDHGRVRVTDRGNGRGHILEGGQSITIAQGRP